MKEVLIIISKNHEQSMTFAGDRYLYIIENEFKSSGSFSVDLLDEYEEIFNIDWHLLNDKNNKI